MFVCLCFVSLAESRERWALPTPSSLVGVAGVVCRARPTELFSCHEHLMIESHAEGAVRSPHPASPLTQPKFPTMEDVGDELTACLQAEHRILHGKRECKKHLL